MKFICPLIVVKDMPQARVFYEKVLGQKVKFDFEENVLYESGFSLHLASHMQNLLKQPAGAPGMGLITHELYFETEELDAWLERMTGAGVKFVHGLLEQPWGQRAMRFYDPDGHLLEVGEPMETVVRRLLGQGVSGEEIAAKTSLPLEVVKQIRETIGISMNE